MHNEAAIQRSFGVTPDSTIVSWLPLHHDMGLIGAMLQPLYTGAKGVILDPLSFVRRPVSWLRTISEEGADISGGPNFAYDLCVRKVTEEEKAGLDLSNWRVAFNGAAQVYPVPCGPSPRHFVPPASGPRRICPATASPSRPCSSRPSHPPSRGPSRTAGS